MYSMMLCVAQRAALHYKYMGIKKKITGLEEHFIPKLKQVILLDQCVVCTI